MLLDLTEIMTRSLPSTRGSQRGRTWSDNDTLAAGVRLFVYSRNPISGRHFHQVALGVHRLSSEPGHAGARGPSILISSTEYEDARMLTPSSTGHIDGSSSTDERIVTDQVCNLETSRRLNARLHGVIPGGAHTYAKGDDQFPEDLLPILDEGLGCYVRDVDGNQFIEYGMGLRSVGLGHAFGPVVDAAAAQMRRGSNFARPARIELEAAEKLRDMVGNPEEMVKFAKNGSDVVTAAVKLARAFTGRQHVAICADHPFFSIDDWFIGTTPVDAGIPQAISGLTLKFRYNDLASLKALFDHHPDSIAAVVLEAETTTPPAAGFLDALVTLCHSRGALVILDEMITGFRWHNGGARAFHQIKPDLVTYGKALGNGSAVSALVGRRDVMSLGGLQHEQPRVFLLSTTHGAEYPALAAAIAVIRTYMEQPVVRTMWEMGRRLADGVRREAASLGLSAHFEVIGRPCNLVYVARDDEGRPSQPFRTLFLRETLLRALIMPSMVVSYAHTEAVIDTTVERVGEALAVYKRALEDGIERHLPGRPVKPVMRRYN
jgi:glutamate-1-semialdehyde 2,1-aminomutase